MERSLYIKTPDKVHNNFGIEFIGKDSKESMEFQDWMMVNVFHNELIKDQLHPFFQGGFNSMYEPHYKQRSLWKYVEFWCDKNSAKNHELILKIVERLSKEFNIDYDIK